jgi:hypothetical protein
MLDKRTRIYFETDIATWSAEHKYLGQDRNLIPGDINSTRVGRSAKKPSGSIPLNLVCLHTSVDTPTPGLSAE